MRLRVLAGLGLLVGLWATASAARVTDPFKAEFERRLGVGRHAVLRRPLPASSAEGEPGYRHDYYSVDVREAAVEKTGTWSPQYLDAEIPAGTRVAVTRVVYKGDRLELTVRTLDRLPAHVQTFEEQETFVEVSPPAYTKSPAPRPTASPMYRREVTTVAAEKVRKRVRLATEAKFYFPWKERDLTAADVPAVLDVMSAFVAPAPEPLQKVDSAAPADDDPEAEDEPPMASGDPGAQIEPGMTMAEVEDVLGPPTRAVTYLKRTRWTYPDCVVIFEHGRVVEVKF